MEYSREKPYIGVTGITTLRQAEAVAQTFLDAELVEEQSGHRGMIGVLASLRALSPNFQGTIKYPNLEQVRQIFKQTKDKAFNVLHYHTYSESNLAQQLERLLDQSGLYSDRLCEGIQFNLQEPPVKDIDKIKHAFPDLKIILQLGPKVLTEKTPEAVVAHLAPYVGLINYALIDPSGGRKRVFKINTVVPVHNQIRAAYPELPLAFAGGFDARNVQTRLWLLFQTIGTANFGIDAEGGLKIQRRDIQVPTSLSITKASRYVQNATLFFRTRAIL